MKWFDGLWLGDFLGERRRLQCGHSFGSVIGGRPQDIPEGGYGLIPIRFLPMWASDIGLWVLTMANALKIVNRY